ncbi:hypothetical protein HYW73_03675 [Candidatus Nomurabacteria bacterium]|nr:hypothetical protein [Candidatus Nomurabacteria bacterium]
MKNYEQKQLQIKNDELRVKKFVIRPPALLCKAFRAGNLKFVILTGLIILVGVGFFGLAGKANAEESGGCAIETEEYVVKGDKDSGYFWDLTYGTKQECKDQTEEVGKDEWKESNWKAMTREEFTAYIKSYNQGVQITVAGSTAGETAFETEITRTACWISLRQGISVPGCVVQILYYAFYMPASLILWACAYFFNVLISITLSTKLLDDPFVGEAWGVVRDLSNIFFILILLYVAIRMILGLAGHGVKEMIAKVVIIALLINFSMFFTGIVIDTSNMLALVFYNKVSVCTNKNPTTGKCDRPYDAPGGIGKDVAGGLVNAFNPTKLISADYLNKAKTTKVSVDGVEKTVTAPTVAPAILTGMLLIAGVLMLFAAYCLFVSGFSFLGRLIELFVLIIFSPFAFMSFTVPKLASFEYLGWDAWSKNLIKVSFMAPIFMFFLYFIFMLVQSKIFGGLFTATSASLIESILAIVLPAMLILILLLKATEYAKKGSGKFGEVVTKVGGQVTGLVAGLAIGAATGGASMALRAGVGGGGGFVANKLASGANKLGDTKWGNRLGFNKVASGLTSVGKFAQTSSFDIRGIKGVQSLAGAAGIKIAGEAQKGGIAQARKDKVEKRMKRAEGLEVREDEGLKQKLNKTEEDLQGLLSANAKELSDLDKLIEKKRQELRDATARFGGGSTQAQDAGVELQNAKDRKRALKDGEDYLGDKNSAGVVTGANAKNYSNVNAGTYVDSAGVKQKRTINYIEDFELRDRKQDVEDENRRRKVAFAKRTSNWRHWGTANREAKHKIIMGSKVESKKDH